MTTKTYIVSFCKAERTRDNTFTIHITNPGPSVPIEAASLGELKSKVEALARECGQTCSAYVRLMNRNERKPAGFDSMFGSASSSIYEMPEVVS